jgi:ribosomal protein S18 acetylase RimI-like enzyme
MQTVVDIRMMVEADIPAVLEIQAVCYTELTPESKASLHAKLGASQPTCLIASIEGAAVGYLISLPWEFSSPPELNAETCQLPMAPDCLYLHDLAVTPGARKYGAGRALVEAILVRLRELGLERASLIAVQNSAPYWERYGFRAVPPSGPLKARLSTYGEDVVYMERAA